jgi:molybdopterin converting factor subunit 1
MDPLASAGLIKITVLFFAGLRERLHRSQVQISVPVGTQIGSLLEKITDEKEVLQWKKSLLYAINRSYVSSDTVLHEGDEAALIPPVAGGY